MENAWNVITEKTFISYSLGAIRNSICSWKNIIWHFIFTPILLPFQERHENMKIFYLSFSFHDMQTAELKAFIYNCILSWVRAYLRDDYISQLELSSVAHAMTEKLNRHSEIS